MRSTTSRVLLVRAALGGSFLLSGCGGGGTDDNLFDTNGATGASATDSATGATATGSGTATAGSGGTATTGASSGTTAGSDGSGGTKFDVATNLDAGNNGGPCGCGEDEWSYIWIANSSQSSVSKVNTRTLQEEGRYLTRPDGAGNPSRTSVALGGRSVAVANRYGGVVKIWARPQFCEDKNGNGTIDTSSGAGDLKAWDQDECVAWYTAFPTYTTQRPVAWGGRINPVTCDDDIVWTTGCAGSMPGFGGGGDLNVHRLDGATGAILDSIMLPGFSCGGFGAYGAAVDTQGNFWTSHNGSGGKLGFVDGMTLATKVYDFPAGGFAGYGITVDNAGRPWVSSYGGNLGAAVFDPGTEQWTTVPGFASQGGIQGGNGKMWSTVVSGFGGGINDNGIVWIDDMSITLGDFVPVAGGTVKGVSLDVDGYVWAVTGTARKFDATAPYTEVGSYGGLSGPYTYSDMTGWGLQNAVCNPVG